MSTGNSLLLILIAGAMNGSFTMPMKWTRQWKWENVWILWAILALVVLPLGLLLITIPNYVEIYRHTHALVLVTAICGLFLGLCQICFGLSVELIGVALTFAITSGVAAAMGSVAPLFVFHRNRVLTRAGACVLAGVILVSLGVAVCAIAGRRREAALNILAGTTKTAMAKGLILAIASGITAASMNLGFEFSSSAIRVAQSFGVGETWAANLIWTPMLAAAALPNVVYCLYLLRKNGSVELFGESDAWHWFAPLLMAILWYGAIILYGRSAGSLGSLGAVLGWPLLESMMVITASVLGFACGEWRNSGQQPIRLQFRGLALLIAALFVLSAATT